MHDSVLIFSDETIDSTGQTWRESNLGRTEEIELLICQPKLITYAVPVARIISTCIYLMLNRGR